MMEQNEQKLTVVGRVVDSRSPTGSDSAAGLPGVTVEVWLKAASTEVVAAVTTGSLGEFAIGLDAAALRPLLGAHPASAFFRVYQGSQLLIDTEESIMWHENGPNQTLRIPVDPTKPKGAGAPALWSVRGRVTDSRGAPLEGMIVHAYDRNLDPPAPKFLGNSATDAAGYYRIAYSRSQLGRTSKTHADLEVSACKQNGATLLTLYTRRVCHAPATAVVDMVVAGNYPGAISEYERLMAAVAPTLGALELKNLDEDRLALAACSAGVDRRMLELAAAAARMAEGTSIDPKIFYGLLRWGLPAERPALLSRGLPTLREALTWATEERVIPWMLPADIDAVLAQFKPLVAGVASQESVPGAGSLDQMLATAIPVSSERNLLLDRYVEHQGDIPSFWRTLRNSKSLPQDAIAGAQRTFQLGAVTRHHVPLIKKLNEQFQSGTVRSLRDLARRDEADWLTLFDQTVDGAPVGVPATVPGATIQEKRQNYAAVLTRTLEKAFPGAALAGRLRTAAPALGDAVRFLDEAQFDFGHRRLREHLSRNPSALSFAAQPAVTMAQLAGMERLHKLTSSASEIKTLMSYGLDSAQSIVRMGRARFSRLVSTEIGSDRAAAIYQAADRVLGGSHALAARHHASFNATTMYVLSQVEPLTGEVALGFPDWPTLFGSLDFCACGHCRSVYSPAAYLVDLLQFLERQAASVPAAGSKTRYNLFEQQDTTIPSAHKSACDVLLERRPDIARLELTCENADTAVPYVDLVNEILEYAVANTSLSPVVGFPDHIATAGTAPELAAQPQPPPPSKQVVYDKAYELLAAQRYPWRLPFNQGLEEARLYLDHLGVPRAHLMEVFRREDGVDPAEYGVHIALERLRLSEEDRRLLAGTPPAGAPGPFEPWMHWGLSESANAIPDPTGASEDPIRGSWVVVLQNVAVLMHRLGVTYDELTALLHTRFVNPNGLLEISTADGAAPLTCKTSELRVSALEPEGLHRMNRFTRMRRALGWSVAELDQALSVLGGGTSDETLIRLAGAAVLQTELRMPVLEMLVLWGPIQTRSGPLPEDRSLYERLFLNKTVVNPVDPAFRLNSSGSELADSDEPIADHAPAVLAALRLSAADLALLTDSAVSQAAIHAPPVVSGGLLNLANLSKLFRATSLSRALKLPLRDLLALCAMSGSDVLTTTDPDVTRRFVEAALAVRATGFGVAPLDYVLRHVAPLASGLVPEQARIDAVLADLTAGLARIRSAMDAPEDANTPADTGEPLSAEVFVRQRLGEQLRLDAATTARLLTETLVAEVDPNRKAIADFLGGLDGGPTPSETHRRRTFVRLEKIATLVRRLKLTADELAWVIDPAWLDLNALPVEPAAPQLPQFNGWLRLTALLRVRDALPAGKAALAELFRLHPTGVDAQGQPIELLAQIAGRTGWPLEDLSSLAGPGGWFTATFAALGLDQQLVRLADATALLKRLGMSAAQATPWADVDQTPAGARATAASIRNAVKAKYSEEAWSALARPLRDVLRERQRGALVDTLVWKRGYASSDELFAELLVDVEMSPCQLTSRIKQAIGSVQLFVQRALLRLERDVVLGDEAAREWTWLKSYRVWEANRKVFLYPENWIEPELRDDKTPFFKALENEMLQSDLDERSAERAFRGYLEKLDQVARLEVMGLVAEREAVFMAMDSAPEVLHVFARTRGAPHVHFYRRLVRGATWTPWEKIELDIQSEHLIPVVHEHRLLLFWAMLEEVPQDNQGTNQNGQPPSADIRVRLAFSEYEDGKWSARRVVDTPPLRLFKSTPPPDFDASIHFRAFSRSGGNHQPSELVVQCLVSLSAILDVAPTWSPSLVRGEFVLSGCSGSWQLSDYTSEYRLIPRRRPGRAIQDRMALRELASRTNDGRMYAPAGRVKSATDKELAEGGEVLTVLYKTPGTFRLVLPHSEEDFLANDPFFYEDSTRSFFVTPEPEPLPPLQQADLAFPNMRATAPTGLRSVTLAMSREVEQWANEPSEPMYSFRPMPRHHLRFATFQHPYVCELISELRRHGVLDGLLNWSRRTPPLQLESRSVFEDVYSPGDAVVDPYPIEDIDFSWGGAYSAYNWELFFHAPLLIADRLSENQRFEEAQRWFHAIFDPTTGSTDPVPARFWKFRPFYENTHLYSILTLLGELDPRDPLSQQLRNQIAAWRREPFNPHLLARMRIVAYQKTVVMKYIDNLIRWGDQLFRRDTIESINEATQLYVLAAGILGPRPRAIPPRATVAPKTYRELEPLLDSFSNALVEIEAFVDPADVAGSDDDEGGDREALILPTTLYFCVPPNDKLLGYWDIVADRLFKIRHCMNIEGVVRQLPLYEPPIDPALLVQAAAAGVDLTTVINDVAVPAPHHRFQVLLQKASELCAEVKALGASLLAAREKRDAEALAVLRAGHEAQLLDTLRQVKERQVDEAREGLAALRASREGVSRRHQFYRDASYMNVWEAGHLAISGAAAVTQAVTEASMAGAAAAHMVPTVTAGAAGISSPVALTTTVDGSKLGASSEAGTKAASIAVTLLREAAAVSATMGSYERRWDEWKLQEDLAAHELVQLDKQIAAAGLRVAIAEKERAAHDLQIEQAREEHAYLRDKFTNEQLYHWMAGQVAAVYTQAFQLAYDMAKRAEKAFRFERGVSSSSYIQFGQWDNLRGGLLAGERLSLDLKRLELAYMEYDRRELELTKHVSLLLHDPVALMTLKATGKCVVRLPEALFDMDYPGHTMRRIKSVSLTLPCVAGPYASVNCTLTLMSSRVRTTTNPADYAAQSEQDVAWGFTPVQAIATSHAQNDSGTFELNFRDERYLPFEGAGAISDWQIELPADTQAFDVDTLSDVVIHLRYTARDGGGPLRDAARAARDEWLKNAEETALARLISLRQEFSVGWQGFLDPAGNRTLPIALGPERFPFQLRSKELKIHRVEAYVKLKPQQALSFVLGLTPPPGTAQRIDFELAPILNDQQQPVRQDLLRDDKDCSNAPLGTWVLSATEAATELATEIDDIALIVHYTAG
ncbi:neuraminidase-like domain-containing protein [Sorangium sp. So ce145]|uniref:Tc toxin subunit A-related protein n=1 Tax=Sorangium sp. So ce145 TaxID=3133285 RepID=UPI003F61D236